MTMYFENLGGTHSEGNLLYPKGAVVPSDKNLMAMFPEKFKRVNEKANKPSKPQPFPLATNPGDAPPVALADEGEGGEEDDSVTEEQEETVKKTEANALGEDVTDKFPDADKAELKVFKNAGKYFIAFADNPAKALNKKPLVKSKVAESIAEYISE